MQDFTKEIRIEESNEYDGLVPFFIKHELEFSEEEPVATDTISCFRAFDADDKMLGACVLAFRENEYIIDGIAVEEEARGYDLGTKLLNAAIERAKALGGTKLYLVARAPGFFKKNDFASIKREDAPTFFECFTCPQYNKTCFPEVMLKIWG